MNTENHMNEAGANAPDWMSPRSMRQGRAPRGFKLSQLEFGSSGNGDSASALERLGLKELVYATPEDSVDLKANHVEPGVLSGMLADTMAQIESKYENGAYDAAAIPLVEQYLAEMRVMAHIQSERSELIADRVADVKEAGEHARAAVYEARMQRASAIRERHASGDVARTERRIAREKAKTERMRRKEERAQWREDRRRSKADYKEAKQQRKQARWESRQRSRSGGTLSSSGAWFDDVGGVRWSSNRFDDAMQQRAEERRSSSVGMHAAVSEDDYAQRIGGYESTIVSGLQNDADSMLANNTLQEHADAEQ